MARLGSALIVMAASILVAIASITIAILIAGSYSSEAEQERAKRREAEDAQHKAEEERQRADAARQLAEDERQHAKAQAKKSQDEANERRLEATRLAATLALDRGLTLCEQGDAERGLLWLARGVKAAEGNPESQGIARRQLSAWSRQTHALRAPVQQRTMVRCAAVSPDGKTVLVGTGDESFGEVTLWNADTRKPIPWQGPGLSSAQRYVASVAFSPDGKSFVTGGLEVTGDDVQRGSAQIWKMEGKELVQIGKDLQHNLPVEGVAFSPDGNTVATASQDRTIRFWDAKTAQPVGQQLTLEHAAWAVAYSPDGKYLLTGSGGLKQSVGSAQLWNVADGKPAGPPLPHQDIVSSVAFSPDGQTLLTGSWDRTARLWDATTGKPIGVPLLHQGPVCAVAFTPDGKLVATASGDGNVRFWDVATGRVTGAAIPHPAEARAIAFSRDGKLLVTGGGELIPQRQGPPRMAGALRFWTTGGRPDLVLDLKNRVFCVALDPEGKKLATGSADNLVRLWDVATGKPIGEPMKHEDWPYALAFSPDGKMLATATGNPMTNEGTARLWDASTGKQIGKEIKHPSRVRAVAFSHDGKFLVTGSGEGLGEGEARLWNAVSAEPVGKPFAHKAPVWSVALSPDGKTLLTGCDDKIPRLWRVDSPEKPYKQLPVHAERIIAVAFGPEGKTVLTAGGSSAQLWDAASGKPVGTPLEHAEAILSAAFSEDGRLIVTGSRDHTARLWDAVTSQPLGPPMPHGDHVHSVTFDVAGKRLATGSLDGFVRSWSLPTVEGDAERVVLWSQVSTGLELTQTGAVQPLGADEWRKREQKLKAADTTSRGP
jgi:WD40 repeat protein